ncbi:alpha-xylosidase [Paenibacillus frigoriresistens]|nr:alpha-xylosidase [Paenibacillus frigoriresistens]
MGSDLLNASIDVSESFRKPENIYFNLSRVAELDPQNGKGYLEWQRHAYKVRTSFNQVLLPFERVTSWEFPPEYEQDKRLPFDISFVSDNIVRVRFSGAGALPDLCDSSPMIEQLDQAQWKVKESEGDVVYVSDYGSLTVEYNPLRMILRDRSGKVLTQTKQLADQAGIVNFEPMPTSIARNSSDLKRNMALSLSLSHGEALVGGGESFSSMNKRGQKLKLWMNDPKGIMNNEMYKPVPFLMSSSGYGVFVHTSAPVTLDIGQSYSGAQTIYVGDDVIDVFFFLGNPHEILGAYTRLTGKSPVPPLWSFGLWMSRITYNTQDEVLDVAQKLRENRIPCDVIHLDTGWFDVEWRCNYEFSPQRFPDPKAMLSQLKEKDFHLSLWQLPYFTPSNSLFPEIVEKGYAIRDGDGKLPTEDAIIDFSNPEAVKWYQDLLFKLFDLGVSAFKADFGEGAPLHGAYASCKSGRLEHNLYPLRYTRAIYEAGKRGSENPVIWARSSWAGGQKYPVHWGGDAETSDAGLSATVRGGLSLGSSGFTFWSHDNGGFVSRSPENFICDGWPAACLLPIPAAMDNRPKNRGSLARSLWTRSGRL